MDVIVILLEIFGLDLLDLGFLAGFAKGVAFLGELPEIGTNVIFYHYLLGVSSSDRYLCMGSGAGFDTVRVPMYGFWCWI